LRPESVTELTDIYRIAINRLGQTERPTCHHCKAALTLALPPGGKGKRTFQCFDCDRPDPLQSEALRWLSSELQPPKS
jgi:hypothetical protein